MLSDSTFHRVQKLALYAKEAMPDIALHGDANSRGVCLRHRQRAIQKPFGGGESVYDPKHL